MAVPVRGDVGCFKQIILSQSKGNSKGKHKANTEGYAPNALPLEGRKALTEEAIQLVLALSLPASVLYLEAGFQSVSQAGLELCSCFCLPPTSWVQSRHVL